MKPTFLLIDACSYVHRAFHKAPERTTLSGEHVGALYISIKMLRNIVNSIKPKYVTTIFDNSGKNFRHYLYPQYKANRPPKPPELESQINRLFKVSGAMGLNPLMIKNVEADDVIATLTANYNPEYAQCLIATMDKDLAAIVNKDVSLLGKDGEITKITDVYQKFGVPPNLITDWLTLQGDSADNIPGIKGCGEKKSAALLMQHGSIEKIIESSEKIQGVIGERIRSNSSMLMEMKNIISLKDDVQVITDIEFYKRKRIDSELLINYFTELEIYDMKEKLLNHIQQRSSSN